MARGARSAADATTTVGAPDLVFARDLEPLEYVMFRAEHDPRSRSAILSVAMLDLAPDFAQLRLVFERASRVVLRLRQHVVVPALPIGPARWVTDPDFDLDFHLRHVRLPRPGTIRQLLDFAQPMLAAPFDTARPLWEAYLVEGITEGEAPAALLMKFHHAVTDGMGGVELMKQLYDFERDVDRGPMPPLPVVEQLSPTDLARQSARGVPGAMVGQLVRRANRATRLGLRAVQDPGAAVGDARKMLGSLQRVVGPPPVPPSPLLRRRGLGRRLEHLEFPLRPFRRAAKAAGGSVNDAYIAAVCGTLRMYHEKLGVPVNALPLAMPVNLRTDDDPAGGNRFAGARLAVPVGEPDPVKRVQRIRELVLDAVSEPAINAMNAAAPLLSRLPTPLLGALSSLVTSTDVQASNVPGFTEVPYIAGAKMLSLMPFGPLPGVPIMIIMATQAGVCYVGVQYDTSSITDGDLFAACLQAGFDEVLALDPEGAGTHE